MPDTNLIGKTGRVTGAIGPNKTGEVTIAFRGGSNAYLAHPEDGESNIPVGRKVVVVDYVPPTTVYVREQIEPQGLEYTAR